MQPIDCETCSNRVLVEKYSPTHTSIQWQNSAGVNCPEFRAQAEKGVQSMFVPACSALQTSIREAVREGRLRESGRTIPGQS